MAIDPTAPLIPIVPAMPAGAAPDSAVLQAMARAALASSTNQLGEIAGRPANVTSKANAPVEQAGQASTQDTGHTADAPTAKGGAVVQTSPTAPRITPETRLSRAVRTAAAEAVPRQAGLAPLMANVRAAVDRPDMPTEVREAGRALLARTPPAAELVTPQGLRRAVERSGVFLEAKMARAAVAPTPDAAPRANQGQDLKAALLVFRGALSAWLAKAAPQVLDIDSGGEPVPSDAPEAEAKAPQTSSSASTAPAAPTRPTVQSSAQSPTSLSGRVDVQVGRETGATVTVVEAALEPEAPVQAAPQPSPFSKPLGRAAAPGVGLAEPSPPVEAEPESSPAPARLAAPGMTPAPQPAPRLPITAPMPQAIGPSSEPEAPPPMSAAPETAEEAPATPPSAPKQAPSEDDALGARFGAFVAAPKSAPAPASTARSALSALVQLGLMAEEAGREDAPTTAPATPDAKPALSRGYGAAAVEATRPKVPPPPYAGGPMAGQKPAAHEVPEDVSTTEVVRRLLKGTGSALARQDLMQIASLPEGQHHHEAESAETRPQGARLNLDLPFVTPQGVAVAQFEISHDGGGTGGGAVGLAERTYKVRFSIDVEPLGPVHAMVTLTGARARVSLWAERAETIARLRAGEESLGAALRQAELTPEVAVHSGAPPTRGGGPLGHFVDQAS